MRKRKRPFDDSLKSDSDDSGGCVADSVRGESNKRRRFKSSQTKICDVSTRRFSSSDLYSNSSFSSSQTKGTDRPRSVSRRDSSDSRIIEDSPPTKPSKSGKCNESQENDLNLLAELGFDRDQVVDAYTSANRDVALAATMLLSSKCAIEQIHQKESNSKY